MLCPKKAFSKGVSFSSATVDRRSPANQLRLGGYPIIYKVLYIPGGVGFLPSTVGEFFWGCNDSWY